MAYSVTGILGAGVCAYGTSVCGFGTPGSISWTNRQDLKIGEGSKINTTGQLPYIDPITGDYVYNDNNYLQGQSEAQQMVYLALATAKNSSSMQQLGLDVYNTGIITSNTSRMVNRQIFTALQHITSVNKITINNVFVEKEGTKLRIRVVWIDNSNGEEFENLI